MEKDDRQSRTDQTVSGREPQGASRLAPGKVTRTSKLSPSRGVAVQGKAAVPGPGTTASQARSLWEHTMDPSMDAAHRGVTALVERGQGAGPIQGKADALGLADAAVQPVQKSATNVQRMAGGAATASNIAEVAAAGVSGSGQDLPHQETIQRSFGDHDLSEVHAFIGGAGGAAAEAIGAEAYATGNAVAFRQPPTLHTAAHEAAHVVQQRAGVQLLGGVGSAGDAYEQNADAVADRVVAGRSAADLLPKGVGRGGGLSGVQMRRLPTNTGAMLTDPANPAAQGENYAANAAGIRRLIEIAEAELNSEQRGRVDTATLAGQSQADFDALPEQTRLMRRVEGIRSVRPDLTLGDPDLIGTGPRANTQDTANLQSLCNGANAIFDDIASGGRDADIDQVSATQTARQQRRSTPTPSGG